MTVYVVRHLHKFKDGREDFKLIGVYSSRETMRRGIDRVRRQLGFRDALRGFRVRQYTLDQERLDVNWRRGCGLQEKAKR